VLAAIVLVGVIYYAIRGRNVPDPRIAVEPSSRTGIADPPDRADPPDVAAPESA
jgi:hypothetical protein